MYEKSLSMSFLLALLVYIASLWDHNIVAWSVPTRKVASLMNKREALQRCQLINVLQSLDRGNERFLIAQHWTLVAQREGEIKTEQVIRDLNDHDKFHAETKGLLILYSDSKQLGFKTCELALCYTQGALEDFH